MSFFFKLQNKKYKFRSADNYENKIWIQKNLFKMNMSKKSDSYTEDNILVIRDANYVRNV